MHSLYDGITVMVTVSLHLARYVKFSTRPEENFTWLCSLLYYGQHRAGFPAILRQAIATPQVFSSRHLRLPVTTKMHLLTAKCQLVTFPLSNNTYKIKNYQKHKGQDPLFLVQFNHR